jgi:hypothetical protein
MPWVPLGGLTPLTSSAMSSVADRLGARPRQVSGGVADEPLAQHPHVPR